jgi:3-oxoacyl-[acyl-carrier protein] reductase
MRELRAQVAVVTGATAGVGRLCCQRLAQEGMRLALVARTAAALESLAAELRSAGADAVPIPADLTNPAAAGAMAQRVEAELGPASLLVNSMNVGSLAGGPFENSTIEQFEAVMNAKPRGFYLAMRALLPAMLARRDGCIINVASGAGVSGSPGFALFSAAEYAVVGLSDAVAREVQERGVHVSVLCPWGIIDSDRVRKMFPARDPQEFMDPEDLVETVVFLAKRSARAWIREVIVRAPSAVD